MKASYTSHLHNWKITKEGIKISIDPCTIRVGLPKTFRPKTVKLVIEGDEDAETRTAESS